MTKKLSSLLDHLEQTMTARAESLCTIGTPCERSVRVMGFLAGARWVIAEIRRLG